MGLCQDGSLPKSCLEFFLTLASKKKKKKKIVQKCRKNDGEERKHLRDGRDGNELYCVMRNLGKRLDEIPLGNPPCRCCHVIKAPPAGRCVNKWSRLNLWSWSFANMFSKTHGRHAVCSDRLAQWAAIPGTLISSLPSPGWMTSAEFSHWLRSGTVLLNSCQLRRAPNIIHSRPFPILISHARVKLMWVMASGPEMQQKES